MAGPILIKLCVCTFFSFRLKIEPSTRRCYRLPQNFFLLVENLFHYIVWTDFSYMKIPHQAMHSLPCLQNKMSPT